MTGPLLESRVPIAAAPMAGGPTTHELLAAVVSAGGFPFLAAGYLSPEALAADVARARGLGAAFGVNLFVPGREPVDVASFRAFAAALEPEAAVHGVRLDPEPVTDDDRWAEKVALLVADPVPVVSLQFGLPDRHDIDALRAAGSTVLATVTTPGEAVEARDHGVDGLIVQGPAAGGHSATFDPARTFAPDATPTHVETSELVRQVRASVDLPLVAAGGVDGPVAVRDLLAAGAEAVVVGTLLLRTDEAGTNATHREALADAAFDRTVVTRVFTGRPARALRNGLFDRHDAIAPVAYPAVHHLTRPLRQAAAKAHDTDRLHLWAGSGYRRAPTGPAADVIRRLAAGT